MRITPSRDLRTSVRAADTTTDRRNNIDAIRLIAATGVLIGHGYDLRHGSKPTVLGVQIGSLAVMALFVISGWLITESWNRRPQLRPFLRFRSLRLFPGLIATIVITTFVLGPLLTTLSRHDYWASPESWAYLQNCVLFFHTTLPGVFTDNPYPSIVNGSVWTLSVEFLCYLAIPLIQTVFRGQRLVVTAVVSLGCIVAFYRVPLSLTVGGVHVKEAALLAAFFAAGSAYRELCTKIGHKRWLRTDVAMFVVLAEIAVLSVQPVWGVQLAWLCLPYVVASMGFASTPGIRSASRYGDFSYGVYLWAFPVQQIVIARGLYLPMWQDLSVVFGISLLVAVCSWRLIEGPMLARKHKPIRAVAEAEPERLMDSAAVVAGRPNLAMLVSGLATSAASSESGPPPPRIEVNDVLRDPRPAIVEVGYQVVSAPLPASVEVGYQVVSAPLPASVEVGYQVVPAPLPASVEVGYQVAQAPLPASAEVRGQPLARPRPMPRKRKASAAQSHIHDGFALTAHAVPQADFAD